MCPDADPTETVRRWAEVRFRDVVAICDSVFADEHILLDDLELLTGSERSASPDAPVERRSATFGTDDGCAVAVVSLDPNSERGSASLDFVGVHPGRRRRGLAHAVVDAAESWVFDRGATEIDVAASGALGIFSGVDTRWTEALCLFEARGYERRSARLELSCQTARSPRRSSRPVLATENVISDRHLAELISFVAESNEDLLTAFERGGSAGTALLARDDTGAPVGAVVHSVTRMGVINPIVVRPGAPIDVVTVSLVESVLAELSIAGIRVAVVAGDFDLGACAKRFDARVSRTSLDYRRTFN